VTLLWSTAFLWTIALELPVYTIVLRRYVEHWWTPVALTLVVNAATHPAFWFVFPQFDPYWLYVLAGELCVVTVEIAIIAAALRRPGVAALASVAANAVSTLLGLVLMALIA
jgi:hypothetical protein